MTTSEEILRRLTIGDPAFCRAVMAADLQIHRARSTRAARRCCGSAALITAGSAGPTWQQRVSEALDAGLSFDEIVGSLLVARAQHRARTRRGGRPAPGPRARLRRRCARSSDSTTTRCGERLPGTIRPAPACPDVHPSSPAAQTRVDRAPPDARCTSHPPGESGAPGAAVSGRQALVRVGGGRPGDDVRRPRGARDKDTQVRGRRPQTPPAPGSPPPGR